MIRCKELKNFGQRSLIMNKKTSFLLAALTGFALTLGNSAVADVKVAFVYVGPIGDHGWTYQHNEGRKAVEAAGYETTYVESVPEGADAERVIRQLATSGHDIVFTTSFGYMDPTLKVAKEFPDIKFEHATGYKRNDNMATYGGRFYEGRHVAGKIAAELTKTKKIGYIASFPIPEVVRGINATALAAREIDPDVTVHVVWVFSWFDPGKEADAAKVLIDQGIDVLMQHTDSPAPVQVAQERGIWAFGQASDMSQFAPKAHLTAIIDNWNPYYVRRVKALEDGSWESGDVWGGFDTGMVVMGEYNSALDSSLVSMAKKAEADVKSGKVHPFTGPIKDRDGTERVAAGKTADDGLLLGMDFFVEGVVGDIPSN